MNFTRKILKERAKEVMATKYWAFFFVGLIQWAILGFGGLKIDIGDLGNVTNYFAFFSLVGTSVLLSISVNIFLANPFLVAYNGFVLLNSSGAEIGSGVVWRIFKENYLNVVKTMFLRDLFVTLWGIPLYAGVALAYVSALFVNKNPAVAVILYGIAFIFIVGGGVLELYKQYSYSMTEYLLAENTGITAGEALGQSKTLMRGYTFFAFKLDISFVGWYLLGVLLCGIGTFFVKPYEAATKAQFYMALKREQGYC